MKLLNQEINETTVYSSFFEFLEKNKDRVFRYWVYKRLFTPLEREKKYIDQGEYVDSHADLGIIREAIILPDNDILLGFYRATEAIYQDTDEYRLLSYYKLSEIRLDYHPVDMEEYYCGE